MSEESGGNEVTDEVTIETMWERVQLCLKDELGDTDWRSWIKNLRFIEQRGDQIILGADTRLATERVNGQYKDRLEARFKAECPEIEKVSIEHVRQTKTLGSRAASSTDQHATSGELFDDFGLRLDERMTFDNFVVDKSNELAHAVAKKTAESSYPQFNPLFIHGGVGLGKTHLMHAIANRIREKDATRKVVYLTAEAFMYRFVKAIRDQNTPQFKEQCRSVSVLMIDDVQFIGGKESTQEEFFHTFNALMIENKQIVISADKTPTELEGVEERLHTRLGSGMVVNINPTTFELRMGIIKSKLEAEGVELSEQVIEFLAHKITSNVRELEGAINRIVANITLTGRPASIDSVHELLPDLLRASNRQVSIADIKRKVAHHYNIRLDEMHSRRRAKTIVLPRQVAMYLAKTLTSSSYPEIGRHFGDRDHTTVMHAVSKIEKLISKDEGTKKDVAMLHSLLQSGNGSL